MGNQKISELSLYGIKSKLQKFGVGALVALTFGLMLLGKADTVFVEKARIVFNEILAPIEACLSKPAKALSEFVGGFHDLVFMRRENVRLRQENKELLELRRLTERLRAQNDEFRRLLNYTPPPEAKSVSAQVIADAGNAFAQSLIAFAGTDEGVSKGDVVLSGEGVVGRIAFVGDESSRILLLTDINSRIPVRLSPANIPAVLSGDNSEYPQLVFLPRNVKVAVGDKVVTSGMAGVFPSDLPVGVVHSVADGVVKVKLFFNRNRLEIVRIVNYGISGNILNVKCETTP